MSVGEPNARVRKLARILEAEELARTSAGGSSPRSTSLRNARLMPMLARSGVGGPKAKFGGALRSKTVVSHLPAIRAKARQECRCDQALVDQTVASRSTS